VGGEVEEVLFVLDEEGDCFLKTLELISIGGSPITQHDLVEAGKVSCGAQLSPKMADLMLNLFDKVRGIDLCMILI